MIVTEIKINKTGLIVVSDRDLEAIIADTLNWFEDGQLVIGSSRNPEHLRRWKAAWARFEAGQQYAQE